MQQPSGDDVIDMCQGVGRVEIDDEVSGIGEVDPRTSPWTESRHVDTAGSLTRQQIPEDQSAVLRYRHQLIGSRAEHYIADHLNRTMYA